MFENPRRGRQAGNFTTNVPKILDLKSFSEQIFSENWRWVPLNFSGPESCLMFAVFAFKTRVSITLKMMQWNYQLTKQDWPVYGLGTVLLFNRFWFQNLPLDPKSYRPFQGTGPWNVLLIGWSKFSTSKNYPDLDSASDWMKQILNQSEALPRSGYWRVISMEFLCSFVRRHFAGKPVVASLNVG